MKKFWIVCVALLWISLTNLGLTSCDNLAQVPPEEAIQLALMKQLTKAQNSIAEDLGLPVPEQPNFEIAALTVSRREKLSESRFQGEGYPSDIYQVNGTVDTMLTTVENTIVNGQIVGAKAVKTQQSGPFEIYLGTTPTADDLADQSEAVETWYLLPQRPKSNPSQPT